MPRITIGTQMTEVRRRATAMRILVINNLYPPYSLGGYEERIATVVRGLRGRGHAVRVITSQVGTDKPATSWDEDRVCRGLIPSRLLRLPMGSRASVVVH